MAGKLYKSTSDFKPPQNKLKSSSKISYTVDVDDRTNEGLTKVYRSNGDGTSTYLGQYKGLGKFEPNTANTTGSITPDEFNYFYANGNYVVTTYSAPLVTNAGDNPNNILGTNFSQAPTAVVSTNAEAATGNVTDDDIKSAVSSAQSIDPVNIKVGEAQSRNKYEDLVYPVELRSRGNGQDRIKFTMFKYSGAKINPSLGQRTISREIKESIGSVVLPIQPSITDSNSVDWSGATLNAVQAFGAAASISLMNSSNVTQLGENVGKILGEVMLQLRQNESYNEAIKVYLAQEAVGIQGLLSRASGAVLNPNLELLFNGPSLRPFNFTFRLSPRDNTEANQVKKIIRFFKQGMSVKTTESDVFLKAPHVFGINYYTYDDKGNLINHPSINMIKKCALISCDVDYTPDGSYMTYNNPDRSMTSYQLTLRFSELDPIYDKDYESVDGNKDLLIGY